MLASDTYLRFVPVADYNGTPGSLTVHFVDNNLDGVGNHTRWDGTTETRRTYDTTADDASSAVSSSGVAWSVSVNSINDKPVISNLGAADNQTVASALSAVLIEQGTAAAISDIDSTDFDGGALTVSFASGRLTGDLISIRGRFRRNAIQQY